jgi:hypothetical protein
MSIRKLLPLMLFALALLAGSATFAADAPPAPMSEEEFLASLQEDGKDIDGVPEPQMRHGSCSWIAVNCKPCATGGEQACDRYRCNYNGLIHYHTVCSGSCSPICNT